MQVNEEQNVGDEVVDRKTEQGLRSAAFENFRRSVGFQFGFVLYSGLEVDRAIDHVCAAAEGLVASLREWQPIETAPTNKAVLVYVPNWEHYGPGIYRAILVDMGSGRRWHSSAWAYGRDFRDDAMPTLWMPLPEPPSAVGSAKRPISNDPAHGQASKTEVQK